MSFKQFQEAKQNLSFSQTLVDKLRAENMAQQQSQMVEEPVSEPQTENVVEEVPQQEMEEPVKEEEVETPEEEKTEAGMLSAFMDEVRALFKGKEEEEKKTQELVEKHNKEMSEIKQGLKEILEDDKES